jgi:hypothetical protein
VVASRASRTPVNKEAAGAPTPTAKLNNFNTPQKKDSFEKSQRRKAGRIEGLTVLDAAGSCGAGARGAVLVETGLEALSETGMESTGGKTPGPSANSRAFGETL